MIAYENDVVVIPESYKQMSVSEIKREKQKLLNDIRVSKKAKKMVKESKNHIIFKF